MDELRAAPRFPDDAAKRIEHAQQRLARRIHDPLAAFSAGAIQQYKAPAPEDLRAGTLGVNWPQARCSRPADESRQRGKNQT